MDSKPLRPEIIRAMFTNDEDEDIPFPEDVVLTVGGTPGYSPEARLRGIVTGYWRDHEGLNALFLIAQHGEYVRIRTPFLYPDGDVIDVFAKENSEDIVQWTVTDLGETIGKYDRPMNVLDICLVHGVTLHNGQLTIRGNQETLSRCIMSLGQAMMLVAATQK